MPVRLIKKTYVAVETLVGRTQLKLKRVTVGNGIKVKGFPYIRNSGQFLIGKGVRINSRMSTNPIGGDCRARFVVGPSAKLMLGDRVALSNCTINAYNEVRIENDVMIGGGTKIYDTDFHSIDLLVRLAKDDDVKTSPILIKEGAFIGAHCIILKGTTIGHGAIVGAGSVVTRDIPDFEIWAGNPAKLIRKQKV